ncbi:MAG: phenylacetate--CoA ligase family protein, partial [Luminiphilus sp.]
FPTAVRNVLEDFSEETSGMFNIQPATRGVLQDPPLPIAIEVSPGASPDNRALAERIKQAIKNRLLVTTEIHLVAHGTLPRETYKSKLVDYSKAVA